MFVCLLFVTGLLDPKSGQVVLAGDPKQLGPIVSTLRNGRGKGRRTHTHMHCPAGSSAVLITG